ncbi:MAG: hypothetical protein NTX79_04905 [Candidatus Micrarchaeota archaeon]|nr:hypothetical protein [Candidatus Micrarchaeota archaeon]
MATWLVNHSFEAFYKTQEYCGFRYSKERNEITVNDCVVYYGEGLVFGIFRVVKIVDNEFNGWEKKYPFQIKIEPIIVANEGITARPLQHKIKMQKLNGASPNLVQLSDTEFNQIKHEIESGKKELSFFQ